MEKGHLELLRVACSHTCNFVMEAGEGLVKARADPLRENSLVSQLPFRMWNPGYDLSRWATSAYCGNAAVTEIHKSPEKSIRTVSMVEWIQMQSSVTFECDFFFFSNRMVCTKYADGWKWPQCLLSSLIAERFLEADLFSISLHLYLRGLDSVWKSDGFKIHVDVLLFLQWRQNC